MKRDGGSGDVNTTDGAQMVKRTDDTCEPVGPKGGDKPAQQLSMSNMMVVVDCEPCSISRTATPPEGSKATLVAWPASERVDSAVTLARPSDPNMATPPVSANGSPPSRHAVTDRTSLTRRREWKSIREQERKAREAVALARTEAHGRSGGGGTCDGKSSQPDRELVCLYEAYREQHLRDMERRLRRLERNSDVWLRALVPVLDNMNHRLAAAAKGGLLARDERGHDGSDDETASATKATTSNLITAAVAIADGATAEATTRTA